MMIKKTGGRFGSFFSYQIAPLSRKSEVFVRGFFGKIKQKQRRAAAKAGKVGHVVRSPGEQRIVTITKIIN